MLRRSLPVAVLLLATSPHAQTEPGAAPAADAAAPRVGYFSTSFDERHPLGEIDEQRRRSRWSRALIEKNDPTGGRYDVAERRFRVYVPRDYRRGEPHGLLVWVSPAPTGEIPAAWPTVLDRHRLICVGADGSGNDELIWNRIALALDGAHNIRRLYDVDAERVYVTGFSGGGRLAARVGMQYPDVFQGGIYQGGCSHFRKLKVPGDPRRYWPARFPKATGKRHALARDTARHVILIGENDPNRARRG